MDEHNRSANSHVEKHATDTLHDTASEAHDPHSEAIYQQALELQAHDDSYEDQIQAQKLFQSIYFYRDADRHANQCTFRAWEIRWDRRKKVAKWVIPVTAAVLAIAFIAFQVNAAEQRKQAEQRSLEYQYSQAVELAESGQYALAIDAFTKLGDYGDSAQQAENARTELETRQIAGLRDAQVGDQVEFGFYRDHISGRYGNEWQVLAREDDRLLLVTNATVGMREFNSSEDDISWQNSTLRAWLNDEFLEDAFTESQRNLVQNTDVTCDDGSTVQDCCFILSVDEARSLFEETQDDEINHDRSTTDNWWLRSSSTDNEHKDICWMNGSLFLDGYTPTSTCGVRVAIWVDAPV